MWFLVTLFLFRPGFDEEILFDEANAVDYWDYFEVKTMKVSPSQKVRENFSLGLDRDLVSSTELNKFAR